MSAPEPFSETYISVGGDDLKLLKKMKVGSRVRVVLYGTLKSKSEHASDVSSDVKQGGSISIAVSRMNLASNSEIADLLDDDDL